MRILGLLGLIFWLGCGVVFAQESERVPVVVTTQPLPRGTILTEEMLFGANRVIEVQLWEAQFVPTTALHTPDELIGRVIRLDLTARTPILAASVGIDTVSTARIGSDTGLLMPEGFYGVPMIVDNLYVAPATLDELDCVQVSAILIFGEGLVTEFILTDSAVVVENAYDIRASVVTVAMPPQAALEAIWLQEQQIPLALVYSAACP